MSLNDVLAALKRDYLKALPQKIQIVQELWNSRDFRKLESEFHKMKGTGKSYGFPEISRLGYIIERICQEQAHQLPSVMPQALSILHRIHQGYASGAGFISDSDTEFQALLALVPDARDFC